MSAFWRSGGVLSAELWQGRHSIEGTDEGAAEGSHSIEGTAEGSHSIEGEAAGGSRSTDEGLPYETMPLGEWLRLPAKDMHRATHQWIEEAVRRR